MPLLLSLSPVTAPGWCPTSSGSLLGDAEMHLANFPLLTQWRVGCKPIPKLITCSCPNLEPNFRSLGLIRPNLQPIYHEREE
jgi:hypothetical protein